MLFFGLGGLFYGNYSLAPSISSSNTYTKATSTNQRNT